MSKVVMFQIYWHKKLNRGLTVQEYLDLRSLFGNQQATTDEIEFWLG